MAVEINERTIYQIGATADNGDRLNLAQVVAKTNKFYKVEELNGKVNIMSLFKVLGKVCKSGSDTAVIGKLIESADKKNEIHIPNMTKYASQVGISFESFKRLMKRATNESLLHKLDVGYYMINPYIIMSKGLTSGGYELQEHSQITWRKLTGLLTDIQIGKLNKLSEYLELEVGLRPNEFNLSVAEYYASNGTITDKQRKAILR